MSDPTVDPTLEAVKALSNDLAPLKALPSDIAAAKADLVALKENLTKAESVIDAQAKDLAEFRALLKNEYGASGQKDWSEEFSKFVKAVWYTQVGNKRHIPTPAYLQKSVADYVTDVDAQGGYLVPRLVADAVTKLTLRHGQIWPLVSKFTMPAGVQLRVPWESTLATAKFRSGSSSNLGQGGAGTEVDPAAVWNADTLKPDWLNGYVKIANEAMTAPGISLPDQLAMQLASDIVRAIESGIIKGNNGTPTQFTGRTAPHDGILYAGSVNTQTAMATVTYALVKTWIGECIADYEGAGDREENFICTTDGAAHVLKGNMTQTGLSWGDPATGWGERLHGYRFITSPHMTRTRTTAAHDYIMMAPLRKIKVGWTGNFAVSFNDSLGWASNETWMMVSTHCDWSLGNPDMYSIGSFTAYA